MATKLSQHKAHKRIVCLAKGESGTGKTVGITSWALQGPLYVLDLDNRIESCLKVHKKRPDILDNVYFDKFGGYEDSYEKLKSIHDATRDNNYKCPYTSILYDGITPLGRGLMNSAISERVANTPDKEKKDLLTIANIYVAELQDYKGEAQGISNILTLLRSVVFEKAGVNIFVTGHVTEVESRDMQGKVKSVSRTMLTGGKKIAAEIPAYFNEIWHFEISGIADNPKFHITTIGTGGNMLGEAEVGDDIATKDFARTALPLPTRLSFTNPKTLYEEVQKYITNPELAEEERKKNPGGNAW